MVDDKELIVDKVVLINKHPYTMTHTRYGRSHLHLNGQLTKTRRSDGAPEPDGYIKAVARKKILHYRQLYVDRPDPIAFMPVAVDTSGRIYDDFFRLLFLHASTSAARFSLPSSREKLVWLSLRKQLYVLILI